MSIKNNYWRCFYIAILLCVVDYSHANQFCFASAVTYYQQIYCELEVKGQTKNLPSFEQFKKNNEVVQASLLRIPAERNNIKLPLPKKPDAKQKDIEIKTRPVESAPVVSVQENTAVARAPKTKLASLTAVCQMDSSGIHCGTDHYRLIGNKTNNHLAPGVLEDTNKMLLPAYQAGDSVDNYVTAAYRQYIEKMCEIGLGGVTMTYAKFAYFYQDLQSKGVNFIHRFEVMYSFLKKDKITMWISEKMSGNSQLTINDCDYISRQYYVCAKAGDNYIFELQ